MTDIGAKLKVTGESQYSKAMKEAYKNTKALDSELKLAEERFKQTGDAQQLMKEKGEILKDQLEQQEKAVKAAQTYLEKLKTAGYDKNSAAVIEWRGKLAQAQQQVLQTTQAIEQNTRAMDNVSDASDDAATAMQDMAQSAATLQNTMGNSRDNASELSEALAAAGAKFSWEGVASTLHGINEAINAVINRAVQMGKALWDAGVDATVWADTLATDAQVLGVDVETLQKWQYAARFVDVNIDTMASVQTKLRDKLKNTGKTGAEFAAKMASIGIATHDTTGKLRTANAVFWDTIDYLSMIEDQATREAKAQDLLGKSVAELNPLILAGRKEWEKYEDRAPIIDADKINGLTTANDAIEDMNAQLEALKLDVLAAFAPTIQSVAESVGNAASAFKDWADSDQGQKALTALDNAIANLLSDFTEYNIDQLLSSATEKLTGLIDTFSDFVSDTDNIKNAFYIISGAIAGLKLAEAAANAASLIANLKLIKASNTVSSAASGAATSAAASAGTAAASSAVGGAVGKAAAVGGAVISKIAGPAAFVAGVYGLSKYIDEKATQHINDMADKAERLAEVAEDAQSPIAGLSKQLEILNKMVLGETTAETGFGWRLLDLDKLTQLFPKSSIAEQLNWYGDIESYLNSGLPVGAHSGVMAEELIENIDELLKQSADDSETIGTNIDRGLVNGMTAEEDEVYRKAEELAQGITETINGALRIESPSKVTAKSGRYAGEGLALGMAESIPGIEQSAQKMAFAAVPVIPDMTPKTVPLGSGINAEGLYRALSRIRVMIDSTEAGAVLLPSLEDMMSTQAYSRRYGA